MKEVKMKIDKQYNVKILLKEYLNKNNISEFYERKIKSDDKTITIFVYEKKRVISKPTIKPSYTHIEVYVTTTVIVSEKADSTAVAICIPSDDSNNALESFDLVLKDNGFMYM